jgi:hypothetical protein
MIVRRTIVSVPARDPEYGFQNNRIILKMMHPIEAIIPGEEILIRKAPLC